MTAAHSYLEQSSPPGRSGWKAWLMTHDHKRLGLMYLWAILFWFVLAVFLGLLMRTELMGAGRTIMGAETYSSMFTLHGVIMIFFFGIPAIPAIFGNFFLPIQLGADDVFFPRLNLLSWYLFMFGGGFAVFSLFFGDGFPDTGWTFYVPFSISSAGNVSLTVTAAFILGMSSMLTGLNFVTTFHRMRHKGMGLMKIPLFTWSLYATAWVQILATPVIAITFVLVVLERLLAIGLFEPDRGGDPLLYQHLFWMYSHPAVYIIILPAMGVISEIIPVFSRKAIFGYKGIVYSSLAIAIAGSLVWAHHMYTSGMSDVSVFVFSLLTFLVAVPSAVKVFSWVSTMYKGSIEMSPPFFLTLCFIYLFTVGGLTGLVIGAAGTDIHVHDTHFVVAHFHFVMLGGTGFAFFAALHYWWPKMFGVMYRNRPAYIGAVSAAVGFIFHFVPMLILGMQGMPRRYYDYLPQYETGNFLAGFGAYLLVFGLLLMLLNLVLSLRGPRTAPANPWGGATLEWSVPSPPPVENFTDPPNIKDFPYDFSGIVGNSKK